MRSIAIATDTRLGCPAFGQGTILSKDEAAPGRPGDTCARPFRMMDREGIMELHSLIVALAIVPVVLDTLGLFVSLVAPPPSTSILSE